MTLVGRVTADPLLRITPSGQPICTVGVATNRTWNDKQGQKQEEVEFHNVVLFGRQAEIANEYVRKGSLVGIEGRLKTRTWTDKGGVEHKSTGIIAEQLHLGPREGTQPAQAAASKPRPEPKPKAEPQERIVPLDEDEEKEMQELFGKE
jgi:single-strand DNA-binding protein